jgi:hypothetical protein
MYVCVCERERERERERDTHTHTHKHTHTHTSLKTASNTQLEVSFLSLIFNTLLPTRTTERTSELCEPSSTRWGWRMGQLEGRTEVISGVFHWWGVANRSWSLQLS